MMATAGCLGIVESDESSKLSIEVQNEHIIISGNGNNTVKFLESSNSKQIALSGELCIDTNEGCEINASGVDNISANYYDNWFVAGADTEMMKISWFNHFGSPIMMELTGLAITDEEVVVSGWYYSKLYINSVLVSEGNFSKQSFIIHFSEDGNLTKIDTDLPNKFDIQGIHFGHDGLLRMFGRGHSGVMDSNSTELHDYATLSREASSGKWVELFRIESFEYPSFSDFSSNEQFSWYTIFPCIEFGPCLTLFNGEELEIPNYGESVIHILLKEDLLVHLSVVTSSVAQANFIHSFDEQQIGEGTLFGWLGETTISGGEDLEKSTQAISHDGFGTFSSPQVVSKHLISDVVMIEENHYYSSQITIDGIPVVNQFVQSLDVPTDVKLEIEGVDTVSIDVMHFRNDFLYISASICSQNTQICELSKPVIETDLPTVGNSIIIFKYFCTQT